MVLGRIDGRVWSESNSVRSLYINRRKLVTANHSNKSRRAYECPVVGCGFFTFVFGMIEIHISEKHPVVDEPSPVDAEAFEVNSQFMVVLLGNVFFHDFKKF